METWNCVCSAFWKLRRSSSLNGSVSSMWASVCSAHTSIHTFRQCLNSGAEEARNPFPDGLKMPNYRGAHLRMMRQGFKWTHTHIHTPVLIIIIPALQLRNFRIQEIYVRIRFYFAIETLFCYAQYMAAPEGKPGHWRVNVPGFSCHVTASLVNRNRPVAILLKFIFAIIWRNTDFLTHDVLLRTRIVGGLMPYMQLAFNKFLFRKY